MRLILLTLAVGALTACNPAATVPEAEKAAIDCLSAKTVVEITDAIRDGAAAGVDPSELQSVRPDKIAAATATLNATYSGAVDAAYLENDINRRLEKIQDALNNRDPNSDAVQIMNDTLELGRSCTFGG